MASELALSSTFACCAIGVSGCGVQSFVFVCPWFAESPYPTSDLTTRCPWRSDIHIRACIAASQGSPSKSAMGNDETQNSRKEPCVNAGRQLLSSGDEERLVLPSKTAMHSWMPGSEPPASLLPRLHAQTLLPSLATSRSWQVPHMYRNSNPTSISNPRSRCQSGKWALLYCRSSCGCKPEEERLISPCLRTRGFESRP